MLVQSPFQIFWEKLPNYNFVRYFLAKFAKYGDGIALVDPDSGRQWKYSELSDSIERCANWLLDLGVKRCSGNVALITSSSVQTIILQLTCACLDVVSVAIDGYLTIDEIWQKLDISDISYCITELQFLSKVEEVRRKAVIRGSKRIETEETFENATKQRSSSFSTNVRNNVIMLYFGLGDTRTPKAIEISQKSLILNIQQLSCSLFRPPNQNDRFLLTACIHHNFGLTMAYYALANGATLIITPRYSQTRFLSDIAKFKITVTYMTPPMVEVLSKEPNLDEFNLSSLRSVLVGGAPIDPETLVICKERLNLEDLRQIYGMALLGGVATISHYGCKKYDSVGVPLSGMLMKIVNPDTNETCLPNQVGHLLVLGPQVSPSFYKSPKTTKEYIDCDNYVKTGDAAFYDENGYIYILGRMREMIRENGVLVPLLSVEKQLKAHPGIDDCAIVLRRNRSAKDLPTAFVVKNSQHSNLCPTEIRQFAASNGKLPDFQDLKGGIFFVNNIPRSITGNVLRQKLSQKRMMMKETTPHSPTPTPKPTCRKHFETKEIECKHPVRCNNYLTKQWPSRRKLETVITLQNQNQLLLLADNP
uniref:AMP-binding domain-containing protein n=1 Tax=Syphacia muris TaxID=451379 RepID=A0A0N5ALA8_9BILA